MAREREMIAPFEATQVKKGISFGVSSYGYDFRISDQFLLPKGAKDVPLDPKNFNQLSWEEKKCDTLLLPAGGYCLARSVEYFKIPRNVLPIVFGKSTYARCGVVVNVTPFEPEWEGFVTVSISNCGLQPVKIYANEGIAQVLFLESDEPCGVSYADKKGKYQGQKGITGAKI